MSELSEKNFEKIKLALEDYAGITLLEGDVEFLIKLVEFSLKEVEKKAYNDGWKDNLTLPF